MTPGGADSGERMRVYATGNEVTDSQYLAARAGRASPMACTAGRSRASGEWLDSPRYDIRALVPTSRSANPKTSIRFALRGLVNKLLASRFDLEIYVNQECQGPCGRTAREY